MSKEKKQNINAPWTFVDMIKSHAMFIDSKGKKVIINLDKMTQPNEQRKEKDFWTEMNTGEQEKFVLEATRLKKDISFGLKLSTPPQPNSEWDWRKEFDDYWFEGYNGKNTQGQEKFGEYIKSFIEKTLETQRREMVEEIRQEFYAFNDIEKNFECNQRVLSLRNKILALLQNNLTKQL